MADNKRELIDGHYQFNGVSWNFYQQLQPGLRCETPDHSTCKQRSRAYLEMLLAQDAEKALELHEARKL
jgi:hypothetical protein